MARRRLQRLLAGEEDVSEYRIVTRDGETRWLRDYGRAVWDEAAGRVTRIYGAVEDITDRKFAEERCARARRATLTSSRPPAFPSGRKIVPSSRRRSTSCERRA